MVLKYAFRRLAKSPGFTAVSVVMLALGIGMSTSAFSVANWGILSTMPFPDQDRLVQIFSTTAHSEMLPHYPGNFIDLRSVATSYSHLAGIVAHNANVAQPGQTPEMTYGMSVTANFLPTLGIQPVLGRGFAADEDQPGKDSVVVIAYAYWKEHFALDPQVIGQTLRIGTDRVTIIGVLPEAFDHTLIWHTCSYLTPLTIWSDYANQRKDKWINLVGRLKPGIKLATAQAELNLIAKQLDRAHPAENGLDGLRATGLSASFIEASTRKLYWLMVVLAVVVQLIACANLASVQLTRAFGRSHEFAVRAALGAGRAALMGPLLAESFLITLAGTAAGLLLARGANQLISRYFTGGTPVAIDSRVILFAATLSLLTALTFGMAPAWLGSRVSTGDALKESSRGSTAGRAQRRLKFTLIVGQFAFALVLLSAALSFSIAARSFLHRDFGWKPAGLFSAMLDIPSASYSSGAKRLVLFHALRTKLSQIPGVTETAISEMAPLYGFPAQKRLVIEGAPPSVSGQEPLALLYPVNGGFHATLGIPLKEGQFLPESATEGDRRVLVINETMARRFWPGKSALGQRVRFADEQQWSEVIGVVGDVVMPVNFDAPASNLQVYCGLQQEFGLWYDLIVKSPLPAAALVKPFRDAIAQVDPDIMIQQIGGAPQIFEDALGANTFMILMLSAFAGVGLMIALIGLYGVISQTTQQRTREIGIRLALGADYCSILRLILLQSGRLILIGVLVGLAGAYGVSLIYRQTMPELRLPGERLQAGIALALAFAGLLACYFPARRAARTNPLIALRTE
jgi:predicted permease